MDNDDERNKFKNAIKKAIDKFISEQIEVIKNSEPVFKVTCSQREDKIVINVEGPKWAMQNLLDNHDGLL